MAAQLICNQWVAGSTPVTSSIQNPWIHLDPGIFLCRTQAPSCAKNDFLRKICARCRKNIVFVKKSSIIQATTTNRRENGMRHSLGTIAWRGLKGRRRDTAMMLCVLAAVFALLTAVLCYQQSGSRAMEVQRQDLYGAWQLARYDLTAADADAFVQQTAPAAVGRAAQYAILVNDKDLAFGALGTVDEGYLSCGQLQLLSGRLPGTAGEAALTTSVLDSIGASYELGQTVTLQAVHGDDAPVLLQFTLCGVLPSYDAYWAVGSNLPVDALVTADSLPQSWDSKIQLLCCYAGAVPLAPYIDGSQDPT
jgi:putative ABC transport system permease protein